MERTPFETKWLDGAEATRWGRELNRDGEAFVGRA
jgi:hypothetical protein